MDRSVLVTGGAGYIGSHTVLALLEAGWRVVVLDDLSTGRRALVPDGVPLVVGNVADGALVRRMLEEHGCTGVLHFAGAIVVPESVADPLKYYRANVTAGRTLLAACVDADIKAFVFSSTAAVYGEPTSIPVSEEAETRPVNPYGRTKLVMEWMLEDVSAVTGLRHVILRYFNVAGADARGRAGQVSPEATHLLKIAAQTALGHRDGMQVFGDDYDTPDGTCIRDYIHVTDLAEAHVAALDHLYSGGGDRVFNCGYGHGFSVREVLDRVEAVSGKSLAATIGPRRAGDAGALVSDSDRIRRELGWRPRFDDLDVIVRTALDWERKFPTLGD